jgi:hypothetical protein
VDDDRLFGDATLEQLRKNVGEHWPAEIIALRLVTLVRLEEFQFFLRYHALSNDAQVP